MLARHRQEAKSAASRRGPVEPKELSPPFSTASARSRRPPPWPARRPSRSWTSHKPITELLAGHERRGCVAAYLAQHFVEQSSSGESGAPRVPAAPAHSSTLCRALGRAFAVARQSRSSSARRAESLRTTASIAECDHGGTVAAGPVQDRACPDARAAGVEFVMARRVIGGSICACKSSNNRAGLERKSPNSAMNSRR